MSLAQFKGLIGPLAEKLTDEKVMALMTAEYQLADAFIEQWRCKQQNYKQLADENKTVDEYNEPNDSSLEQNKKT